jgi:glycolate oxidase FAD binding subunit
VITEVTVRLHPVPAATFWVGTTTTQDRLDQVLAHLVASQLVPHAVEVRAAPGEQPTVVALVSGTEAGATARAEELAGELGPEAWVAEEPPSWWGRLPAATDGATPRPVLLRTTARLSGIPDLVRELGSHGATVTGSAGAGVLHAALPSGGTVGPAVDAVRRVSTTLGGSTVVLDADPPTKAGLDTWGPVPAIELMRRVKAEFDPDRILAPGRFVGGL